MTSPTESITGLIGPVVAAGVVLKITDTVFGNRQPYSRRTTKRRKGRRKPNSGFGDFSNLGL